MAYGKGKKRIQVAVSDELYERLTRLATAFGVTKSSMCAMYIAQASAGSEIALNSAKGMVEKIAAEMDGSKEAAAD